MGASRRVVTWTRGIFSREAARVVRQSSRLSAVGIVGRFGGLCKARTPVGWDISRRGGVRGI